MFLEVSMILYDFYRWDAVNQNGWQDLEISCSSWNVTVAARLILGLCPTNERRRYKVTPLSLAGCKPRMSPEHYLWCPWKETMISVCWLNSPVGVLGPKIAGGVAWATENWTQKDRGENGILGPKRSNFVRICTQKIVFVLVDEKKHPKKIEFGTQRLKKGVKTAAHMYHPSYREYPPPPPGWTPSLKREQ